MAGLIQRPEAIFDSSKGPLHSEHFQAAYVTNDLEKACDLFRKRFGVQEFGGLGGEMPSGGHIEIKLVWIGGIMYELIQCSGPGTEMYTDVLEGEEFSLVFHHHGYFVHNQASWDGLLGTISAGGWEIRQINDNVGFMQHCYIYVPELGHHLEYIFPEEAGRKFFENIPQS